MSGRICPILTNSPYYDAEQHGLVSVVKCQGSMRLDEADWCQSCQDNMPAVHELREVRRSIGGLASSMFRAYRREAESR